MQSPDFTTLVQFISSREALISAAALFVWVLVAVVLFKYLKRTSEARQIKSIFARHCEAIEIDAVLPDGLDGFMFVDYLLLLRGRIIALRQVSRKGVVLCLADSDEWTCIENNRSEKFRNPLLSLKQSVQQMQNDLNFKAIDACVLFGSESSFPKGAAEGIIQFAQLDEALAGRKGSESEHEAARLAWEQLTLMNRQARKELDQQLAS